MRDGERAAGKGREQSQRGGEWETGEIGKWDGEEKGLKGKRGFALGAGSGRGGNFEGFHGKGRGSEQEPLGTAQEQEQEQGGGSSFKTDGFWGKQGWFWGPPIPDSQLSALPAGNEGGNGPCPELWGNPRNFQGKWERLKSRERAGSAMGIHGRGGTNPPGSARNEILGDRDVSAPPALPFQPYPEPYPIILAFPAQGDVNPEVGLAGIRSQTLPRSRSSDGVWGQQWDWDPTGNSGPGGRSSVGLEQPGWEFRESGRG